MELRFKYRIRPLSAILLSIGLAFITAMLAINMDVGNRWVNASILRSNGIVVEDGIASDTSLALHYCDASDATVRESFGYGIDERVSELYYSAYAHWVKDEYVSDVMLEEFSARVGLVAESLMYDAIESDCDVHRMESGGGSRIFLQALLMHAITLKEAGEQGKLIDILSFALEYILSPKWGRFHDEVAYQYDHAATFNLLLYIADRYGLIGGMAMSDRLAFKQRVRGYMEQVQSEPWRRSLKCDLVQSALEKLGDERYMPLFPTSTTKEFIEEWLVWRRSWVTNRLVLNDLNVAFALCDGQSVAAPRLYDKASQGALLLVPTLEEDYKVLALKLRLLLLICEIENYRDEAGLLPQELTEIDPSMTTASEEFDSQTTYSVLEGTYTVVVLSGSAAEAWPRDIDTLYQRR